MKHKWPLGDLIDHRTLLPNELELVSRSKTGHSQLGVALLLKYYQPEHRFPRRQWDVPKTTSVRYVPRISGPLLHEKCARAHFMCRAPQLCLRKAVDLTEKTLYHNVIMS